MFQNKKSISNKLKDKKVTKIWRVQTNKLVYFTVEIEGLNIVHVTFLTLSLTLKNDASFPNCMAQGALCQ